MRPTLFKSICRLLVASMIFLSFQSAQAGMIGVDPVVAAHGGQADRAGLLSALGRSEVASQLQSMGLDPQVAKERVAAMTDEEVRTLSGRLDQLPAGATSGWGVAAVVIVIAALVYYFYNWKK